MGRIAKAKSIALINSIKTHWCAFLIALLFTSATMANPVLDNVAAGSATINQTVTTTTINQTSQKAILNWQSFNIGAGELTHFNQPVNGVALNRISAAQGASQIYGSLTATGKIILINPAGVFFGPGSFVNVGGLIATTANISNSDFLNGYYNFNQPSNIAGATISNAGQIIAADHGLVALVGGNVTNSGHIQANLGHVVLASGKTFTMAFDGNGLINFAVDSAGSQVSNSGSLIADGGQVLVTAKAASGVIDNIINLDGLVQAKSVGTDKGDIVIRGDNDSGVVRIAANMKADGGNVTVTGHNILLDEGTHIDVSSDSDGAGSIWIGGNYLGKGPLPNANALVMAPGTTLLANAFTSGNGGEIILWSDYVTKAYGHIEAKGGAQSGDGGFVETSSKNYLDVAGLTVNTSAANGQTGTWLLDPLNVTINAVSTFNGTFNGANPDVFTPSAAGSTVLNTLIQTNLASNNVKITTGSTGAQAGNITVSAPITWSNANKLTLEAANNIIFGGVAITNTASGHLALIADADGSGAGTITNLNGTGSVALSGGSSRADLFYNPGTFGTQDPIFANVTADQINPYMLVQSAANLQDIGLAGNLGDSFGLTKDIDMSGFGAFTPLGTFTGKFHGNGHLISNIVINTGGTGGLFSQVGTGPGASGEEIAHVGVSGSITGGPSTAGIVGINYGTVTDVYNLATISGAGDTGGVVGNNWNLVTRSFNLGTVTSSGNFNGGVIGYNRATASYLYNSGSITGVQGTGGVAGITSGSLTNSYNTGSVTGTSITTGGVAAWNTNQFHNNYNSGAVSGPGIVGGVIGRQDNPAVTTNNFWDTATSGQGSGTGSGAATGMTGGTFGGATDLSAVATYSGAGWGITNTVETDATQPTTNWFIFEGQTRPMLMMEYQTDNIRTPHAVQLMGTTLDGDYQLAGDIDFTSAMANVGEVWNTNSGLSSGSGFYPIAFGSSFTGTLDGNNNAISGFYINRPTTDDVAMFSATSAAANISDFSIGGTLTANQNVAGLIATNAGTVDDVHTSINITIPNPAPFNKTRAAGFIATNSGAITNSSNTGNVIISNNNFKWVGGFIAQNLASGSISNSYNESNIIANQTFNGGGFVGSNAGTISNSYTIVKMLTDSVGSPSNTGTFVGYNAVGATIDDSYSLGYTTGQYNNGGFVGSNEGTINRSYHSGAMGQDTSGGAVFGGFVGINTATGIINNSFWDTDTTGMAAGFGSDAGTITNLQGGCFTGACSNGGTVNMSAQATYTGATWTFPGTWNIISGSSLPYLSIFYPTTPRAISGLAGGSGGDTIKLVNAGNIQDTAYRGVTDGFFYFLEGNNAISGIDKTIANSTNLLAYVDGGSAQSNLVFNTGIGSVTGLDMTTANRVNVDNSATAIDNAAMNTIKDGLTDPDILFTVTGPDIAFTSGVDFITDAATTYTIDGNITATNGNIVLTGPSTITVANPVLTTTTTGDISILGNLAGGGNALTISPAGTGGTIGGTLTGLTSLTKNGTGTITLAASDRIADTIPLIINAGTFGLGGFNETIPSLTGTGNVTLGAGTLTVNHAGPVSYGGVISGTGGFAKGGAGTFTFTNAGSQTYTGATNINAGTLTLSHSNIIPDTSAVTIAGSATLDMNNFDDTIGSLSGAGDIINFGAQLAVGNDNTSTSYSGSISGIGNFVKTGTGTLTISGSHTYGDQTIVNAGTLQSGANNVIPDNSNLNLNGGTYNFAGFSDTIGSISGTTNIALGAGTVTTGNNNGSQSHSGIISGAGHIVKIGTGTQTFTGANTYTGTTTVNDGVFAVSSATALGPAASSTTTVNSGGILNITGVAINENIVLNDGVLTSTAGGSSNAGTTTLTGTTNTINSNTGSFTLSGDINGATALILQGAGTFNVTGDIGNTTALSSIQVDAATTAPDILRTTGNQTYNALITTVAPTFFTATGTTSTIDINNGVAGGNDLNLAGSNAAGTYIFDIAGPLTIANLVITAQPGSTASLTIDSATQYTITSADGGTLGNAGITGGSFTNIQNLTGGSANDVFTLLGGTLSGSIIGGGGTDTVVGDNVANTFNITGADTGTVTGVTGTWSDVENLMGGTSTNNFVFSDGATMSGSIDGGTLTVGDPAKNTIDVTAYTPDITTTLTGSIFNGTFSVTGGGTITAYTDINNLLARFANTNTIDLPAKTNTLTVTGAKAGFIGDPTFFNGYNVFNATTPGNTVVFDPGTNPINTPGSNIYTVGGSDMTFNNFNTPATANNANTATTINPDGDDPVLSLLDADLFTKDQYNPFYDDQNKDLVINPFCAVSGG